MKGVSLMYKLFDKVKLSNGDIGYIVDVYDGGKGYEVELTNKDCGFILRTVYPKNIVGKVE